MKALMWLLLGLAAFVLLAFPLFAGPGRSSWGPKGCDPVGPPAPLPSFSPGNPFVPPATPTFATPGAYVWRVYDENPDQAFLMLGTRCVGAWDFAGFYYRPFDGKAWGNECKAPVNPPKTARPEDVPRPLRDAAGQFDPEINFGLDPVYINGNTYWRKGVKVDRGEVEQELRKKDGAKLEDDRDRFRLVVAGGPEAERKKVLDAYQGAKELEALRAKINLWSVNADHWSVKDVGFPVTDKAVMICFQAPDGEVLHRQEGLAGDKDWEAVRKAAEKYDAKKDPDLRKQGEAFDALAEVPPAAWTTIAGAAVLASIVALKGRKPK
jgi:hypothetical protein